MDHDNCPLTFLKALLNIIGGNSATLNINYYYYYFDYYYYRQQTSSFKNNACHEYSAQGADSCMIRFLMMSSSGCQMECCSALWDIMAALVFSWVVVWG